MKSETITLLAYVLYIVNTFDTVIAHTVHNFITFFTVDYNKEGSTTLPQAPSQGCRQNHLLTGLNLH